MQALDGDELGGKCCGVAEVCVGVLVSQCQEKTGIVALLGAVSAYW